MTVHTPHVRGVCWRLHVRRADIDDFVQEGCLAMKTPIARFDRSRGAPLWAYARPFVRGEVIRLFGKHAGLSAHEAKHYRSVQTAREAVIADGAAPTPDAVYARMRAKGRRGAGLATVAAILDAWRAGTVRLDQART